MKRIISVAALGILAGNGVLWSAANADEQALHAIAAATSAQRLEQDITTLAGFIRHRIGYSRYWRRPALDQGRIRPHLGRLRWLSGSVLRQ